MTSRAIASLTIVMLFFASGHMPGAQTLTTQQIVDQFYPARLSPEDGQRFACYQVYATLPSGDPSTIVAAYTDGFKAVVRVLRNDGGTFSVAADSDPAWQMGGADCDLDLVDVDGDSQKEIFATFYAMRGAEHWIMKWDGATLRNMTATRTTRSGIASDMSDASLVDIYHDGTLQVFVADGMYQGDGEPRTDPDQVYRLSNGQYVFDKYVLAAETFEAGWDHRAWTTDFTLSRDSVGPFRIHILNGDRLGGHRVTSATVVLNGAEVVTAGRLTSQVELVDAIAARSLPASNVLAVTLTGAADSYITVVVDDSTVR
jgi:hypothetical protein